MAHNSLLVYRPGEVRNDGSEVWQGLANDGGQRWDTVAGDGGQVKDDAHLLGGITRYVSVPEVYDYVQADLTRAYHSNLVTSAGHEPKVSLVARTMAFLRPELDGTESFEGTIPYAQNIPGKPAGVSLAGTMLGGISESTDTSMVTIRGWNLGPTDGRLLCRTLLPERRITRVVGGADAKGERTTSLAQPYSAGDSIVLASVDGIEPGDFVYLGPTAEPYSSSGQPYWPVDDVLYRGWGNVESVDAASKTVTFKAYRSTILEELPAGTVVVRSGHGNQGAYEFMDAEYQQWPMWGEGVANAGPYDMQHGSWRLEVEPADRQTEDVFLHVMKASDADSLEGDRTALQGQASVEQNAQSVTLVLQGQSRTYRLEFDRSSPRARVTVTDGSDIVVDHELTPP